jgi:streptomycin 6-kinase
LALDRARVIRWAFVHSMLSACWSAEDGEDGSDALNIAQIIEHDLHALL